MRPRGIEDPAETISRVISDLGLEEFTQVSRMGRMIRIEIVYDPLSQERRNLISFKQRLKRLGGSGDSVGKHLVQQIEYFLERLDRITLERVLVAVSSSDGIQKLEKQLAFLQREMEERRRKAREMKRLVRSLSSYIREYLRNVEGA